MALTRSVDQVDENGRELLTYGTDAFPIAFFDDDLSKVAVPTHWHDEMEIALITKGIVNARIAGADFILTAGEGYFANSGILHSETLGSKAGRQHALVFSPRIISQTEDLIWQTCVAPVYRNAGFLSSGLRRPFPGRRSFCGWPGKPGSRAPMTRRIIRSRSGTA